MAMSIYKSAFERAVSDNDVTHTVKPSAATKASSPPEDQAAPELVRLRKAKPIDHLLPMPMKWLMSLLPKCGRWRWRTNIHALPTFSRWTGATRQRAAGTSMNSSSIIGEATDVAFRSRCTASWKCYGTSTIVSTPRLAE